MAEVTPTFWSDEEYAVIATALLYPASRRRVGVDGFFPTGYALSWQLDGRLMAIDETTKQGALSLARMINQGELGMIAGLLSGQGGGACGSRGAVLQVGDIKLDPRLARTERESTLTRARQLLGLMVGFDVNPNAQLTAAGGLGGTWRP